MDIISAVAGGVVDQLGPLKQKVIEFESMIEKMLERLAQQETAYDSMVKSVSEHESAMFETIEYLQNKQLQFRNTGVLISALSDITSGTEAVISEQLKDADSIKLLCSTEYEEKCAEIESRKQELSRMRSQILEIAKLIGTPMTGGGEG